jgi:Cu(I)/Ag(I) efflux system membrane fusion protein
MGMDLIPVYEEDLQAGGDAPGTVSISPAVAQNLGVRTGKVLNGPLDMKIQTVGFISFDENRLSHFHSRVDGWIEKLSVTAVGDPVKQGQQLFELYSPKLVTTGEEYLAALASNSRVLIDASTRRLESLGVEPEQIDALRRTRKVSQRLAFFADQDGYIAALNVREGMFIQPATTILSIGGLDTVWVIAEIFERQAGWIETGQKVEMTISSYPGERWQGQVDYVYPVVNAQTRTLRARIKFDNPGHRLKPNMFAQLEIHAGYRDNALSIPREAVIRDGHMDRVVKVLGDGRYRSVRIETGIESGDRVEVLKGLKVGDEVVVSAQFLIDSESSVAAELGRIEEPGAQSVDEKPQTVWVEGVIQSLMPDHRMATVKHAPVKEWNWPAMTMDFVFSESIDLAGLTPDQAIRFQLQRDADNQYRIIAVESAPVEHSGEGEQDSHQHTQPQMNHDGQEGQEGQEQPPDATAEPEIDEHAGHRTMQEHDHD